MARPTSLTSIALLVLGCSGTPEEPQSSQSSDDVQSVHPALKGRPSFAYKYVASPALGHRASGQTAPLLRPHKPFDAHETMVRAASALELNIKDSTPSRDTARGVARVQDGPHYFEVAERSGHFRYSNRNIHNGISAKEPPGKERALSLARDAIDRLDAQGLVSKDEVLWEMPTVSHRYEQTGPGGNPGEPFREPDPARAMDTRVKYYRTIDGTPVSGSFLRFVFTNGEQLSDVRVSWRPAHLDTPARPASAAIMFSPEQANDAFEKQSEFANLPIGSSVEVVANQFVYQDGSPFDTVNFLEPGYLFLYQVKTPVPNSSDVVMSKKRVWFLPATAHGEVQAPSSEAARAAAASAASVPSDRLDDLGTQE